MFIPVEIRNRKGFELQESYQVKCCRSNNRNKLQKCNVSQRPVNVQLQAVFLLLLNHSTKGSESEAADRMSVKSNVWLRHHIIPCIPHCKCQCSIHIQCLDLIFSDQVVMEAAEVSVHGFIYRSVCSGSQQISDEDEEKENQTGNGLTGTDLPLPAPVHKLQPVIPPFDQSEPSAGSGLVLVQSWFVDQLFFCMRATAVLHQSATVTASISQRCQEHLSWTTCLWCCSWLCMPALAGID